MQRLHSNPNLAQALIREAQMADPYGMMGMMGMGGMMGAGMMGGMMGGMKNQMVMMVPQMIIMGWINFFFQGFVLSKSLPVFNLR